MSGLFRIAHSAMCAPASLKLSFPCGPICTCSQPSALVRQMLEAMRVGWRLSHHGDAWGMRTSSMSASFQPPSPA